MNYMICQINDALNEAVGQVAKAMKLGGRMQEPDYTAAITLSLPAKLEKIFGPKVKVGGCFVHQNPIVHFENQKKGCELGDLLVLCRKVVDGEQRYNSALFQLKMAKNLVETPDNLIQLKLYTEWPIFTIGPKFDSNKCYDIEPKTVTPGAQYMFVVNPYFIYHDALFTHSIPEKNMPVDASYSFGSFLWDFIHWQKGLPFADENYAATNKWSKLMWDIIARTNEVVFHRRNINKDGMLRQNGDFFQFLTADYNSKHRSYYFDCLKEEEGRDIPNSDDPIIFDEKEHGAISILFIDIDADELSNKNKREEM